ncbi:MAG: methyl-accepting chemotaxis protein [Pseudomonadales bacterium]
MTISMLGNPSFVIRITLFFCLLQTVLLDSLFIIYTLTAGLILLPVSLFILKNRKTISTAEGKGAALESTSQRALQQRQENDQAFSSLVATMNYVCQVLPVHSKQLSEVVSDTETAALNLGKNVKIISDSLKESLNKSIVVYNILMGSEQTDDSNNSIAGMFDQNREVMDSLLESFNDRLSDSEQVLESFAEFEKRNTDVEALVQRIEYIANTTNLLSLNAAIEAARAGEYGRGFAVVADEVRALSAQSTQTANEIRDQIRGFTSLTREMTGVLKKYITDEQAIIKASKNQTKQKVDEISDVLSQVVGLLKSKSNTLQEENSYIQGELGNILESLQFQDAVRQRIEHMQTDMKKIVNLLGDIDSTLSDDVKAKAVEMANELAARYTMSAERKVHAEIIGTNVKGNAAADGSITFL